MTKAQYERQKRVQERNLKLETLKNLIAHIVICFLIVLIWIKVTRGHL